MLTLHQRIARKTSKVSGTLLVLFRSGLREYTVTQLKHKLRSELDEICGNPSGNT